MRSDRGSYAVGDRSHWHQDEGYRAYDARKFQTLAEAEAFVSTAGAPHDISFNGTIGTFQGVIEKESVEHREKYSMGHGYYLSSLGRYSGWQVSKHVVGPGDCCGNGKDKPVIVSHHLLGAPTTTVLAFPKSLPTRNDLRIPTITINDTKAGIEIRFPARPDASALDILKAFDWRWSRFSACWYHRDTPDARIIAERVTGAIVPGHDVDVAS